MPNWAFGTVKVTGTREGVKSFVERFISSDDQSTVPGKRFFARSFSEQKREQSVKDAMEEFEGKADNETAECFSASVLAFFPNCLMVFRYSSSTGERVCA